MFRIFSRSARNVAKTATKEVRPVEAKTPGRHNLVEEKSLSSGSFDYKLGLK